MMMESRTSEPLERDGYQTNTRGDRIQIRTVEGLKIMRKPTSSNRICKIEAKKGNVRRLFSISVKNSSRVGGGSQVPDEQVSSVGK